MGSRSIADGAREGSLAHCDEELLAHLEKAVQEVFGTMLSSVCELVGCTRTPPGENESVPNVALEAVVGFHGPANGAVILRCTHEGAYDIARGLLMLGAGDTVEIAEVRDALGECANMVTGALKTRALDPHGDFRISLPRIDSKVDVGMPVACGRLVYRLAQGCAAIEIWLEDAPPSIVPSA